MLVLVTPVKNAEKTFPITVRSVLRQTCRPAVWVIVDDGSTDQTPEMIRRLVDTHDWIVRCTLQHGCTYESVERYGYVVRVGFTFALNNCALELSDQDLLAVLDSDVLIKRNYYEKLLDVFRENPNLGVASGEYREKCSGSIRVFRCYDGSYPVCGAAMVLRKKCYQDMGEFPLIPKADLVSMIKAREYGWKVRVAHSTIAVHLRPRNEKHHIGEEYEKEGSVDYRLGYRFVHVVIRSFLISLSVRVDYGVKYFSGYLRTALARNDKISDPGTRLFFRNSLFRMRRPYKD